MIGVVLFDVKEEGSFTGILGSWVWASCFFPFVPIVFLPGLDLLPFAFCIFLDLRLRLHLVFVMCLCLPCCPVSGCFRKDRLTGVYILKLEIFKILKVAILTIRNPDMNSKIRNMPIF